jgi:hypothetical protein
LKNNNTGRKRPATLTRSSILSLAATPLPSGAPRCLNASSKSEQQQQQQQGEQQHKRQLLSCLRIVQTSNKQVTLAWLHAGQQARCYSTSSGHTAASEMKALHQQLWQSRQPFAQHRIVI